jgi:hypothetical protein
MKSIKLKAFFLAAGFFAISSTFAQDTTNKHKSDTSKLPKHDSTSMIKANGSSVASSNLSAVNSSLTKKEDNKAEAKKEGGQ